MLFADFAGFSRLDEDPKLHKAIHSLQAWRKPAQRQALSAALGEP